MNDSAQPTSEALPPPQETARDPSHRSNSPHLQLIRAAIERFSPSLRRLSIHSGLAFLRSMLPMLAWAGVVCVVGLALFRGLELRVWTWEASSRPMRFLFDIGNAWNKGAHVWRQARLYQAKDESAARAKVEQAEHRRLPPPQVDRLHPPAVQWRYFFKAYLSEYDYEIDSHPDEKFLLDYAPLRLLIMSAWVKQVRDQHPGIDNWTDDVVQPLLALNTGCELAAAVLAFLLARYWLARGLEEPPPNTAWRWMTRSLGDEKNKGTARSLASAGDFATPSPAPALFRDGDSQQPSRGPGAPAPVPPSPPQALLSKLNYPSRPVIGGLIAALFLWFNAAVILEAHAWPQWDVWIVPVYLAAALLVSIGWGFTAGVVLIIGAMAKGQLFLAAPLLVLWPLFAGKPGLAARVVVGAATAVAALTAVWLVNGSAAWAWVACVTVSAAAVVFSPWRTSRRLRAGWLAVAVVWSAAAATWPWAGFDLLRAIAWIAAAATLARWAPRKAGLHAVAAAFSAAVFIAAARWDGDLAWLWVGFGYGTRHLPFMNIGPASNLAANLGQQFGWSLKDPVALFRLHVASPAWWPAAPFRFDDVEFVQMRTLLASAYAAALVLCSAGAAARSRRNDPRVLVSLVAPWVAFFAVMGQMHERYLIWAAALTAVAAGINVGYALLHLLLTALSCTMILPAMLGGHEEYVSSLDDQTLYATLDFARRCHPGIGWLTVAAAAVYVFLAVAPPSLYRRTRR